MWAPKRPLPMPVWQIRLFGGLAVARDGDGGKDDAFSRFGTRKAGALLAFLAYHRGQAHPRETLCDLLWPDDPPQAGRARLRVTLTSLRRQLEPPGVPAGSVVVADGHERVGLAAESVTTDVAEVEGALSRLDPPDAPATEERVAAARVLLARFTQPLLPGFYDDWVVSERERLTQAAVERLAALARRLPPEEGLDVARHAARLDPLSEEPLFALLPLLAQDGRHAEARRAYEAFRRRAEDALGGPPSDELSALADSLPGGRRRPSPPAPATPLLSPAASPAPRPKSLPVYLTRFFGREGERAQVQEALVGARLVTMTGPGGVGKTRLAVETARAWEGAAWFVPLADVGTPELLPAAVFDALRDVVGRRPPEDSPDALLTQAAAALAAAPEPLLVLDNLEQVADGAGSVLLSLLGRAQNLRVLVTSRLRLYLPGEAEVPVGPLPTPPEGESFAPEADERLAAAAGGASVALFLDRARSARPDFQMTPRNAADVLAVCRMLEGIPLAIELVAARGGTLVAARMREMLAEEDGGGVLHVADRRPRAGAGGERHRSLHAAISWSYRLLPPALRRFFARLAVFRGGFTAEAAASVCADDVGVDTAETEAVEALARLRAHSLVGSVADAADVRFTLLESLRTFAGEQLSAEERAAAQLRHVRWFAEFAERADAGINGGDQALWLARVDAEQGNLRAAMEAALEADPARAVQLAGALAEYWSLRGRPTEGRAWLGRALRAIPTPGGPMTSEAAAHRSRALHGAGALAVAQGEGTAARTLYEESLRLRRAAGDAAGVASTLNNLGLLAMTRKEWDAALALLGESLALRRTDGAAAADIAGSLLNVGVIHWERGDHAASAPLFEEALALYRARGDRVGEGRVLNNLGGTALALGDFAAAESWYEQSLAVKRAVGHGPGIAITLANVGVAALYQGRYAAAAAYLEESLAMYREMDAPDETAQQLRSLGQVETYRGNGARAFALLAEALGILRASENPDDIAADLEGFAIFAAERGEAGVVPRLLGAADAARARTDSPLYPAERVAVDRAAAQARAALGDAAFDAAFREGSYLTMEDAASLALSLAPDP